MYMSNELLSNIDIIEYCKLFKINLHECMSKDLYNDITARTGCYVINLEDSVEGNGTHWTCLCIASHYVMYFDSYGLPIPEPIKAFVFRYKPNVTIIYSSDIIQSLESVNCGWFCIFFMWWITVKNQYSPNSYRNLNIHNALYSFNRDKNDSIIQKNIKYILLTI